MNLQILKSTYNNLQIKLYNFKFFRCHLDKIKRANFILRPCIAKIWLESTQYIVYLYYYNNMCKYKYTISILNGYFTVDTSNTIVYIL